MPCASRNLNEAVLSRVEPEPNSGCWLWMGALNNYGYGQIEDRRSGVRPMVHRVVYEAERGPIPAGLQLDHLCRVRNCVNPAHLEPVTHRENQVRGHGFVGKNVRRTHCLYGHPLDMVDKRGWRRCRTCHLRQSADAWEAHRLRTGPRVRRRVSA